MGVVIVEGSVAKRSRRPHRRARGLVVVATVALLSGGTEKRRTTDMRFPIVRKRPSRSLSDRTRDPHAEQG